MFDGSDGVTASTETRTIKDYGLSPELLELSVIRHDLLDTGGLTRYIAYLQANDLDATAVGAGSPRDSSATAGRGAEPLSPSFVTPDRVRSAHGSGST